MSSSKQKQKLSGRTSCNTSFAHHSSPFLSLPFPSLSIPGRPGAIGLPRCAEGRHQVAQTEHLGWREGSVVGAEEGAGAGGRGCGRPPVGPEGPAHRPRRHKKAPTSRETVGREANSEGPRTTWAETNTQPRQQKESARRQLKREKKKTKKSTRRSEVLTLLTLWLTRIQKR